MTALLIYPEFPDTYWSFKHALKFLGKRAAQPPLGLMTVAAMLPGIGKSGWGHQRGAGCETAIWTGRRGAGERHCIFSATRWRPLSNVAVHAGCELLWAGLLPAAFQLKI